MSLPKKIFFTSSIILVVILLLWGVYLLSFKQTPAPSENTTATTKNSSTQPAAQTIATISAITDEAVLAPTLSSAGDSIKYYSKSTGKAFELDIFSHAKKTLSDQELPGLAGVSWSPDITKVISRFSKNSALSNFSFYDYTQKKGSALMNGVNYTIWQNNNKIVYSYAVSSKEQTLNIANPDGTAWEKIITLPTPDARIAPIPKTSLISFWNKPDALTAASMQSVPSFGGEVKTITSGKFGADYLWSSDGGFLLESSTETPGGTKLQLGIMNSLGGEYKTLGIPTMVSKCAWSKNNKTVYYALPGSIPDGTMMPNDYNNAKLNTSDTFWKVDVATGEKTRLVDLNKIDQAYDATHLFLSPDESKLFFVNRVDGKLYQTLL